jgi:hypothetical protein
MTRSRKKSSDSMYKFAADAKGIDTTLTCDGRIDVNTERGE